MIHHIFLIWTVELEALLRVWGWFNYTDLLMDLKFSLSMNILLIIIDNEHF